MYRRQRETATLPAEKTASTTAMQGSFNEGDSKTSSNARSSNEQPKATSELGEDDIVSATERPWTVLSESEVKSLLIVASFAAATSPLSTSTYYPSVTALARDLGVSVSRINLTISSYQVRSPHIAVDSCGRERLTHSIRSSKVSPQPSLPPSPTHTAAVPPFSSASLYTSAPTWDWLYRTIMLPCSSYAACRVLVAAGRLRWLRQ
jgi:hypothetical protein